MKQGFFFFVLLSGLLVTVSCGIFDEDDDHGGQIVSNASKILSTSLATSALTATACSDSVSNCTPDNLEGRIFAAGALLGKESDGSKNYNMTFLADSEEIINDPSQAAHPEGSLSFNLLSPTVFSGKISIPEEDSMPSSPVISRLETYFDYIDATFTISGTEGVDGSYTVRTVFRKSATIGNQLVQSGDKLLKTASGSDFKWCDTTGCTHTSRPDSPLQDQNVLNIAANNGSQPGNVNYALYSIDLKDEKTVTYAEISDATRLWSIDYDVSKAIGFSKAPSGFTSEADIVASFRLEQGCNFSGCINSENRIRASLTIGAAGSAE